MVHWKKTALLVAGITLSLPLDLFAEAASASAPAPAIPSTVNEPVIATDLTGVSNETVALVKIIRPDHKESKKDPLSQFGAGFAIVAFNKSNLPITVGPESVTIKDKNGQLLTILTAEKVAELKQKQADHARTMGMLFGFAVGALGAVGAGSANAATAASSSSLETTSMALMVTSNTNADAIASQTDTLVAAYNTVPLVSTSVAPLHAASGRVLVQGLKDSEPATVIVTIAGETHQIDFTGGKH